MLFWMYFFRAKIAPELQIDAQSVLKLPQNQWKIDSRTGFARLRRNLDFWWRCSGFAWFSRSRRPLNSYKFHKSTLQRYVPIAPKSSPRSIFQKICENLLQKRPPKAPQNPLKVIKIRLWSPRGPRGVPGPTQDPENLQNATKNYSWWHPKTITKCWRTDPGVSYCYLGFGRNEK